MEARVLEEQLLLLLILALPVASAAWTVTHEEVFREPREYCLRRSRRARSIWSRKFFYLFTCEYCFSHWLTLFCLLMTRFKLAFEDWRGYVVAGFALVWVANVYMSLFARLRLGIKSERLEIEALEDEVNEKQP